MIIRCMLLVALLLMTGCYVDYRAHVESNTSWYGLFDNDHFEGHGDAVVDLDDDHVPCVSVYKDTRDGYLSVRIVAYGGGILNPGDTRWVETTAPYGAVAVCGRSHEHDDDCGCEH